MDDPEIVVAPDPEPIDFMRETFKLFQTAAEQDQRRPAVSGPQDIVTAREYLSIRQLAEWSGWSVRTIQEWTKDPVDPLPSFKPGGGKVIVRKRDFDEWFSRRMARQEREAPVGGIVRSVLDELRGGR